MMVTHETLASLLSKRLASLLFSSSFHNKSLALITSLETSQNNNTSFNHFNLIYTNSFNRFFAFCLSVPTYNFTHVDLLLVGPCNQLNLDTTPTINSCLNTSLKILSLSSFNAQLFLTCLLFTTDNKHSLLLARLHLMLLCRTPNSLTKCLLHSYNF